MEEFVRYDVISKLFVKDLLSQKRIRSASQGKDFSLVRVDENDSIAKVLHILEEQHISSAPLTQSSSPDKIIGIVDMFDLVTFCTAKLSTPVLTESIAKKEIEEFLNKRAVDAVEMSARNLWNETSENIPLLDLFTDLSHPNVHRAAVINEEKKIYAMITQSDVLHFLYYNKSILGKIINSPISSWSQPKQVESIDLSMTFLDGLKIMWSNEISGIAVVDENNDRVLVGNISTNDLKKSRIPSDMFRNLHSPIGDFLDDSLQNQDGDDDKNLESPKNQLKFKLKLPVSVKMSDTLERVLELITLNKVHRVFIVDESQHPIGVISLSDIISLFKNK